ncbi:MAG: ribose-phosphate diphosphokinase [Oscillospiraceae bacterium]|nr:ribose-phosphate diphosphokinase [Oscillospiraceae bacterium]
MKRPKVLKVLVMPGTGNMFWRGIQQVLGDDYEKALCKHEWTYFNDGTSKVNITSRISDSHFVIVVDPYNSSPKYPIRGKMQNMCPDKHAMNLLKVFSAIGKDPKEVTVIMPSLYGARQHKRSGREDLIPAKFLQILEDNGVRKVITFDMHSNSFDLAMRNTKLHNYRTRQLLLDRYRKDNPHVKAEDIIVLGVDVGSGDRVEDLTDILGPGADYAICRKSRDTSQTVDDGTYKITKHELLVDLNSLLKNWSERKSLSALNPFKGKHVIIYDDILDTGKSLLGVFHMLKELECAQIDVLVSFGFLTKGLKYIGHAKDMGMFNNLYMTNLVYVRPVIKKLEWVRMADASTLIGEIIKSHVDEEPDQRFFNM